MPPAQTTSTAAHVEILIGGGRPNGRSERIRTSGLYVPNVALYQAELHSDNRLLRGKGPTYSADIDGPQAHETA